MKEHIDKMNKVDIENESLRKTQDKHDDEIIELEFKIKEFEHREEKHIKRIEELVETINTNTDEWFLLPYKNLTSQGKREIRNVINVIKPQLQKGTLSRLRKNTGINFSNLTANPSDEVTELKKKVIEFAEKNRIDVPDKKKYSKGASIASVLIIGRMIIQEKTNSRKK